MFSNNEIGQQLGDIPYPLRLVVESLHYCSYSNPVTEHMQASEMMRRLTELYGEELVQEALKTLRGETSGPGKIRDLLPNCPL